MARSNAKINSEINDLMRRILNSTLFGKKIYLLGSSEYGPVNEPIRVKSTIGLYNKFGKEGSLINAFHEIKYTTQNNEVYLVKTTGEHAYAYLNTNILDGEVISNSFILMSSESNEIFNDVAIYIDIDRLTIVYPNDLNMKNHSLCYMFSDYPNVSSLANAINLDTKNKRSYMNANYTVDPGTPTMNAFFCCNPDVVYLYGGQCGLHYSKNMLYTALEKTYDMLESEDIDIIIPVDAFMDDIYPDDSEDEEYQYNMKYYHNYKDYLTPDTLGKKRSFFDQLINFCINQLNFGLVTTGVIGYNSVMDYTTNYLYESDDIAQMYLACLEYNRSICLNEPYSFLVSVIAGDIEYNHGTIIDNGYLAYGAFNASIQVNTGNTNIKISDNISLYNEFSEEILAELADNGIVTFRHSPLYDTPVVYDGITAISRKDSPLKLYCNVRMIQMCIAYLNQLFQAYIGHNFNTLMQKKIIDRNIESILSILKSRDIITSYNYELEPNFRKGELTVHLDLRTNFMTKGVHVNSVVQINTEENQ